MDKARLRQIKEIRKKRLRMIKDEAVPRDNASAYIFGVLFFFLLSLLCTRLFMEYFYDNVGSVYLGGLHIQHHFYGAILIIISAVWSILYSNDAALRTSAVTLGVGLGLFIDEMGEYMTPDLNYWWKGSFSLIYVVVIVFIILYIVSISFQKNRRASVASGIIKLRDYFTLLTKDEALQIVEDIKLKISELNSELEESKNPTDIEIKIDFYKKQLEFAENAMRKCNLPDTELPESRIRKGFHAFLKSKKAFALSTYMIQIFGVVFIGEGVAYWLFSRGWIFIEKVVFIAPISIADFYSGFILGAMFLVFGWALRKRKKWSWYLTAVFTIASLLIFGVYGFYANPATTLVSVVLNAILLFMIFQPEIKGQFLRKK